MKSISNVVAALLASGLVAGLANGGTLDEPVGSAQAATDPATMVRGQLAEYERLLGQNFLNAVAILAVFGVAVALVLLLELAGMISDMLSGTP